MLNFQSLHDLGNVFLKSLNLAEDSLNSVFDLISVAALAIGLFAFDDKTLKRKTCQSSLQHYKENAIAV